MTGAPGTSTYALIDCVRALRLLARIVGVRPDDALQWYVVLDDRPCLAIDSEIDLTPLEADLVRRMIEDDLEVEPRPLRLADPANPDGQRTMLDGIVTELNDEATPDA